jgi:hypothetical protein
MKTGLLITLLCVGNLILPVGHAHALRRTRRYPECGGAASVSVSSMKRLIKYDSAIALAAILIWVALVVAEVKFEELWFFKYVFWGSLLALMVAFPVAGLLAFRDRPKSGAAAAGASLLLTPVFIIVGVMLVWWFKIAIGGQ